MEQVIIICSVVEVKVWTLRVIVYNKMVQPPAYGVHKGSGGGRRREGGVGDRALGKGWGGYILSDLQLLTQEGSQQIWPRTNPPQTDIFMCRGKNVLQQKLESLQQTWNDISFRMEQNLLDDWCLVI